ncbi:MAG: amidohydrolase family protein [Saprospiraceae bacterium]
MKLLKWFAYSLAGLILIFFITLKFAQFFESKSLKYLSPSEIPNFQNTTYLIKNANLVSMTSDTILENQMVLVRKGEIIQIDSLIDDKGLAILDAQGAFLSPGLTDMHMHLWDKHELGLYLANGVTNVRSLLGMPFHLEVKDEIKNGLIAGPTFFTSSPQFSGAEDGDILKKPIESPEQARKLVKEYKEAGYDFIKTYNLLPKDIFDAVLEESEKEEIPVVAHPSFKVDYNYHFDSRISTVEHTEDIYQQPLNYEFNYEKLDSVVAAFAKSGQTHCPTLSVFYQLTEIYNKGEAYLTADATKYINPFINFASNDFEIHMGRMAEDPDAKERINRQHQFHLEIVGKLHKAGVNIVCGTDAGIVNTPAGFSIHQELGFYKEAGMSNYEALKTATVNPSKLYPQFASFGTIEKGKTANLILIKGNPLEDLAYLKEPKWVMVGIMHREFWIFKTNAYERKNFL